MQEKYDQNIPNSNDEMDESSAQADSKSNEQPLKLSATTNAVAELLEGIRPGAGDTDINNSVDKKVELKQDNKIIYQDETSEQNFKNELSLALADRLQDIVQKPQGSHLDSSTETIQITVNDQPVFKTEKGIVTVNKTTQQSEVAKPPPANKTILAELLPPPYYGGTRMAVMPPQPIIVQTSATPASHSQLDIQPTLLERLEQADEQKMPLARGEQWMKIPLKKRFREKLEQLTSSISKGRAADVAIDLLQTYGHRQNNEHIYDAEQYRIRGFGRHILVQDRQGVGVMTIKTRLLRRPVIENYRLTPQQENEFLGVRAQILKQGMQGFSKDPLVRSQQLGGLTPQGDAKLAEDLKAFSVADVARELLNAGGSKPDFEGIRMLNGQQYTVVESRNTLAIFARDRGQIFSQKGGTIESKLTAADTKHFVFLSKELANLKQQRQLAQCSSPIKNPVSGLS